MPCLDFPLSERARSDGSRNVFETRLMVECLDVAETRVTLECSDVAKLPFRDRPVGDSCNSSWRR